MDMEIETTNIKAGDRIVGKKTGTMVPSTVVGIIPAKYSSMYHTQSTVWDNLYPEWREKDIVYCEFDEPTRNITYQEFLDQCIYPMPVSSDCPFIQRMINDKQLFNEYARFQYEKQVPYVNAVCYPVDDVDLL